jgi:probable rRNA maturation factor
MTDPAARQPRPISIVIAEPKWRDAVPDIVAKLRRAARLALKHRRKGQAQALTILLGDDATLQRLNCDYRGKDKPTNVLSFPAAANEHGYLGDIAMAYGVAAREARAAGKSLCDHASHLAVHGVLHLLGYDHETAADAELMEPLEVAILAGLGIADPYAARPAHVA